MWVSEQSVESPASSDAVWRVLRDLPAWPTWDLNIERVEAEGPAVAGTTLTMVERGVGPVSARIVDVVDGQSLTLSFDLPNATLNVNYRIGVWAGKTRVYHR